MRKVKRISIGSTRPVKVGVAWSPTHGRNCNCYRCTLRGGVK